MTIRSKEKFTAKLWDWGILAGCFGLTRIAPTDIDGCVEKNGQTLLIEAKGLGVPIPRGQERMFENQARTGFITIIVVWGDVDDPKEMMVFNPYPHPVTKRHATTRDGFRHKVAAWYTWASKQTPGIQPT